MTASVQESIAAGVLLVLMEPPASMEEEYNDWYDTEHLPQRRSLPGFLGGSRWVCQHGWPRWAAIYPMASAQTVLSAEYLAVSGGNGTPWSKRILPRTIGRQRVVGTVVSGSDALPVDMDGFTTLSLTAFPLSDIAADLVSQQSVRLRSIGASHVCAFMEGDYLQQGRLWFASLFNAPVVADDITRNASRLGQTGAKLSNTYTRYKR